MFDATLTAKAWEKIGTHPHHGIDLPLSALHTEQSCGIGEYTDLIPLIDWCARIGFDVIMLLPLNDTYRDPSPYNALSAFALHPIYIGLSALPHVREHPDLCSQIAELQELNRLDRVDYAQVFDKKELFLRLYFARTFEHYRTQVEDFGEKNPNLKIYALFKTLKEALPHGSWQDWPSELRSISASHLHEIMERYRESVHYHLFCQFLAFQQLKKAKEHAEKRGLFLKGDIPILISPESADVWFHSEFFDMQYAAGVPPDYYAPEGQYWGFPIYRWERLMESDFTWWKERLRFAGHFYHIYRIDHVIGFFHTWAIPRGEKPIAGHYRPSTDWECLAQARLILENLLHQTTILPIAEDLGVMPEGGTPYLREVGICGTSVLRWMKKEGGQEFIALSDYPKLSMTTVSTHDSETLAQWWQNDAVEATALAHNLGIPYTPFLSTSDRFNLLLQAHKTPSLFHINLIGEYLSLFPELIAPNPLDERINIPGYILPTNWTYRIRPSVEELARHPHLTAVLERLLQEAKGSA